MPKSFAVKHQEAHVLFETDDGRKFTIGNMLKVTHYFAVEFNNGQWRLTLVPKDFHDTLDPLRERTHPESDTV